MKKLWKRTLSLLLVIIMLAGAAPLVDIAEWFGGVMAHALSKPITAYSVGDIIEFGSYPQSEVKDSATIAALNAIPGVWQSYGYMSGAGTDWEDGSAQKSDYMQYCDVTFGGKNYRGVRFSTYRPWCINYQSTTSIYHTYQDDHGYMIDTTYWFRYDPLQWRVLDPSTGLVLCEYLIDSQPFSDTLYIDELHFGEMPFYSGEYYKDADYNTYANNYYESSLRKWLNEDFLNTAFISAERAQIEAVERENKAYSASYSKFDSKASKDKITLLTYDDMTNTAYQFSSSTSTFDVNRSAVGTDYAKCQGLSGDWWLRSASDNSICACGVDSYGWLVFFSRYGFFDTYNTNVGVRPAIQLKTPIISVPKITLRNFTPKRTVDYRTTITFEAEVENPVSGGEVHWIVDGQDAGTGMTFTVKEAKKDFTVQAKYIQGGTTRAETPAETVKVKAGFFARLQAFFRALFRKLPVVVQEYLGFETRDLP